MDEKINELYETLGIAHKYSEEDNPNAYDVHTPYEKCSATISVPITAGNSAVFVQNVIR